ncbi:ricin-type beta-trefoil lectin domain protein [Streptomyces sp. NPDC054842]
MQHDPGGSDVPTEGGGPIDDPPDAQLTELLRGDPPTAYTALKALRGRHGASVLAYARLCTTSESAASQLAAQTFTLAARETARGIDPKVPWRHQLLLLAGQVATSWVRDQRAAGLNPGLLLVLSTTGHATPVPSLLPAFHTLPTRAQGLIWYAAVEREPAERTAVLLGLTREEVTYGTDQALQSLSRACLKHRLAESDDPRCGDFRRLIEESVRPDNPRFSTDLNTHMARCAHCSAAYAEVTALRDGPRSALADGLLPWAGAQYVAQDVSSLETLAPQVSYGPEQLTVSWPSRRFVLRSAAVLGVALVPVLLLLLFSGGAPSTDQGAAPAPPSTLPAVTVSVTATPTSPTSPAATSARPSHRPAPSRSAVPQPSPTVTFRPPGSTYAQVVNVASGLCLDIRNGELAKGTDVTTAPCTGSRTQRWRVDVDSTSLRSAADGDLCLDSRGSTDRGVGIWPCSSLHGEHGDNLRFTVDGDGAIRPAVAHETAVTPDGDDGLSLVPFHDGPSQRWQAGDT